jgi:hypothetical protein
MIPSPQEVMQPFSLAAAIRRCTTSPKELALPGVLVVVRAADFEASGHLGAARGRYGNESPEEGTTCQGRWRATP